MQEDSFAAVSSSHGIVACVVRGGLVRAVRIRGSVQAQTSPSTPQSPPAQPAAVPTSRVFGSDAGRVPNFIKPDNATDFEAVVARLREALQKIDKPARGQQPTGWKV
jgi:hypothetical protein